MAVVEQIIMAKKGRIVLYYVLLMNPSLGVLVVH